MHLMQQVSKPSYYVFSTSWLVFCSWKLEALLTTVKGHRTVLFGTLFTGVSNKHKRTEWECMCESINAAELEALTTTEIKTMVLQ